jgi:hypothetical protein
VVIESPLYLFVILDYYPDGDLFGMVTEKQHYLGKTEAIKSVFIQIIRALQFYHCLVTLSLNISSVRNRAMMSSLPTSLLLLLREIALTSAVDLLFT